MEEKKSFDPSAAPVQEPKYPINVSLDTVSLDEKTQILNLNFIPPNTGKSPPSVLITILDVSGSMSSEATLNSDTTGELQGFSRLDLVKHSMNTIIATLQEKDFLVIITFSNNGQLIMQTTQMNKPGKELATKLVKDL